MSDSTYDDFDGVISVTIAWGIVYYFFLFGEMFARKRGEGVEDDSTRKGYESAGTTATRALRNTTEQAFPFLLGLWMYAIRIDAEIARTIGWVYIGARAFYPFAWGITEVCGVPGVPFSTIPGYVIICYFYFSVFFQTAFDVDVHQIGGSAFLALALEGFGYFIFTMAFSNLVYSRSLGALYVFGQGNGEDVAEKLNETNEET